MVSSRSNGVTYGRILDSNCNADAVDTQIKHTISISTTKNSLRGTQLSSCVAGVRSMVQPPVNVLSPISRSADQCPRAVGSAVRIQNPLIAQPSRDHRSPPVHRRDSRLSSRLSPRIARPSHPAPVRAVPLRITHAAAPVRSAPSRSAPIRSASWPPPRSSPSPASTCRRVGRTSLRTRRGQDFRSDRSSLLS